MSKRTGTEKFVKSLPARSTPLIYSLHPEYRQRLVWKEYIRFFNRDPGGPFAFSKSSVSFSINDCLDLKEEIWGRIISLY